MFVLITLWENECIRLRKQKKDRLWGAKTKGKISVDEEGTCVFQSLIRSWCRTCSGNSIGSILSSETGSRKGVRWSGSDHRGNTGVARMGKCQVLWALTAWHSMGLGVSEVFGKGSCGSWNLQSREELVRKWGTGWQGGKEKWPREGEKEPWKNCHRVCYGWSEMEGPGCEGWDWTGVESQKPCWTIWNYWKSVTRSIIWLVSFFPMKEHSDCFGEN